MPYSLHMHGRHALPLSCHSRAAIIPCHWCTEAGGSVRPEVECPSRVVRGQTGEPGGGGGGGGGSREGRRGDPRQHATHVLRRARHHTKKLFRRYLSVFTVRRIKTAGVWLSAGLSWGRGRLVQRIAGAWANSDQRRRPMGGEGRHTAALSGCSCPRQPTTGKNQRYEIFSQHT